MERGGLSFGALLHQGALTFYRATAPGGAPRIVQVLDGEVPSPRALGDLDRGRHERLGVLLEVVDDDDGPIAVFEDPGLEVLDPGALAGLGPIEARLVLEDLAAALESLRARDLGHGALGDGLFARRTDRLEAHLLGVPAPSPALMARDLADFGDLVVRVFGPHSPGRARLASFVEAELRSGSRGPRSLLKAVSGGGFFGEVARGPAPTLEEPVRKGGVEALAFEPTHISSREGNEPVRSGGSAPASEWTETPYEVHREIARGGMGAVLEVTDRRLERQLAMKVLLSRTAPADVRERFVREARVQGQLEHPGICPVHELGESPSGPFFTMKKVNGRSLASILEQVEREHAPSRDTALPRLLELFLKICDTVAFAHSRRILHRDLKPANVMVGSFGEVLLMDWGLAKRLDDDAPDPRAPSQPGSPAKLTLDGLIMGTPQFMAPEQARGDPVGPAADVYGLGAILYAILTLEPPVDGPSTEDVLRRVRHNDIARPELRAPDRHIPRDLADIAMHALALAPEDRYPTAEALRDDVRAHLDGRAAQAAHYSPVDLARKWVARHRGAVVSAALVSALAILGGTSYVIDVAEARTEAELSLARSLLARGEVELADGAWIDARTSFAEAERVLARNGRPRVAARFGLAEVEPHVPPAALGFEAASPPHALAFTNDTHLLVIGRVVELFRLWPTERLVAIASGLGTIQAAATSHDRQRVALADRRELVVLDLTSTATIVRRAHEGQIAALGFDPSGALLVVRRPGTLERIPTSGGAETRLELGPSILAASIPEPGTSVFAIHAGGQLVAYDVERGAPRIRTAIPAGLLGGFALHPSLGAVLLGGKDSPDLAFAELGPSRAPERWSGHRAGIRHAAFSGDGRRALVADRGGVAMVWDLARRRPDVAVEGGRTGRPALSPSGRWLAVADDRRVGVHAADGAARDARRGTGARSGGRLLLPEGAHVVGVAHAAGVELFDRRLGLALGPRRLGLPLGARADGRGVYLAGDDGQVELEDLLSEASLGTLPVGELPLEMTGDARDVFFLRPDSTGTTTLFGASADGRGAPRALVSSLAEPRALELDRGGRWLAVAGGAAAFGGARAITLFDRRQGGVAEVLDGHKAPVIALAFAVDGDRLYSIGEDSHLAAWPIGGSGERRRAPATGRPTAIAAARGVLAVGLDRGEVALFDPETLERLGGRRVGDLPIVAVGLPPEGDALVALDADGTLARFHLAPRASGPRGRPVPAGRDGALRALDAGLLDLACRDLETSGERLADLRWLDCVSADRSPELGARVLDDLVTAGVLSPAERDLRGRFQAATVARGDPPLFRAIRAGRRAEVEARLGAPRLDPKERGPGAKTLLIAAAETGDLEIVTRVLEAGVELDATDQDGYTALARAAALGHARVVELLLDAGARLDRGPSPLEIAARQAWQRDLLVLRALLSRSEPTVAALEAAIEVDNAPAAEALLRAGAPAAGAPGAEEPPIALAVRRGSEATLARLLAAGASPSPPGVEAPIFAAIAARRPALVERLVAGGADLAARDRRGASPLTAAILADAPAIALLLVRAGADLYAGDGLDRTPFSRWLASGERTHLLFAIASARPEPDREGPDGWTALHHAVTSRELGVVERLVSAGTRNPRARSGITALELAESLGEPAIAEVVRKAVRP